MVDPKRGGSTKTRRSDTKNRSSFIIMQNLVVSVCVHVSGPKNLGDAGPHPLGQGVSDPQKHAPLTRVTIPKLVALSQIVWGYIGVPKNFENAGAPSPWDGGVVDPLKT